MVLGKESSGLYYLLKEPYYESRQPSHGVAAQTQRISPFISNLHLSNIDLWHFRLGHLSFDTMKHIGFSCNNVKQTVSCQVCPRAKLHRQPFPLSMNKALKKFEVLHVDLWGPYKCHTYSGFQYFLTVVDDCSRAMWVHLLSHKSNAFPMLQAFILQIEKQFDTAVKIIRSDNGLEFQDTSALQFYKEKGIIHQTSCVERPQQNGIVERKHKHVLEVARALMIQSGLPLKFWGDGVLTAHTLLIGFLHLSWDIRLHFRFYMVMNQPMIILKLLVVCVMPPL